MIMFSLRNNYMYDHKEIKMGVQKYTKTSGNRVNLPFNECVQF